MKTAIAIGCGILISLAILAFSNLVATTNRDNPYFNYITGHTPGSPVHILIGEKVEVPFEFHVDRGVSKIGLEFAGVHSGLRGISLADRFVEVTERKVQSKVTFRFVSRQELEAGSHILTIVAKDVETGKIVRKGKIPFAFNMTEVIAGCSC